MVTSRCSWGAVRPPDRGREASGIAVEVDEDPISSVVLQALNRIGEMRSGGLVDRRPGTLRAWAYFEVLMHDRALPERRRGGLVDSGAEPRPQRTSRCQSGDILHHH